MGKTEYNKGANAEREVANILQSFGYPARRGQVFNGEPDIVCPGIKLHFEVKRHEKIAMPAWIRQAKEAAKKRGLTPAIVFKQSRQEWFIALPLTTYLKDHGGIKND